MKAMKILFEVMMVFMVLGGMALATPKDSQTTTVTADLLTYLKVTAPGSIAMNLVPGPQDTNVVTGSVKVDSNVNWALDVGTTLTISGKDWYGKLYSPTNGIGFGIDKPMAMVVGAHSFYLKDIPDGVEMATGPAGSNVVPFKLEQEVAFTDKPASDYSAVIEFDATST